MGPAVGGQPQADGAGDGLGNIASGRIGHPRGDPLVVTSIGQNTLSRTGPRAHHPRPPPDPSRTTAPIPLLWTASSGEKGSFSWSIPPTSCIWGVTAPSWSTP